VLEPAPENHQRSQTKEGCYQVFPDAHEKIISDADRSEDQEQGRQYQAEDEYRDGFLLNGDSFIGINSVDAFGDPHFFLLRMPYMWNFSALPRTLAGP
jgi:hypothetical protein